MKNFHKERTEHRDTGIEADKNNWGLRRLTYRKCYRPMVFKARVFRLQD